MQQQDLVRLLVADHERIRKLKKKIMTICEDESSDPMSFFHGLKLVVTAHAKAEEYALYSLFEDLESEKLEELKDLSLEGYEEHSLVEGLLTELAAASYTDHWKAKFTVLDELLDHHLDEEEEEFFPKVRKLLGKEELVALGEYYAEKRLEILGKENLPMEVSRALELQ